MKASRARARRSGAAANAGQGVSNAAAVPKKNLRLVMQISSPPPGITGRFRSEAMTEAETPQNKTVQIEVAGEDAGTRLDRVLAQKIPELSRSRLKALILDGRVSAGQGAITDPAFHVAAGATIRVDVPPPQPAEPKGENIPLDTVYEDDAIIVINK